MLLLRLWNYIRGYVIILVEGYFLEKFINICTHRQILLWNIKKKDNCSMTLGVSIKGFKMLRPVAKKTKCRIRVLRKKGVPFLINRYKKRKTFALGALLFVFLFYVLSSFIWAIEVTGNEKTDSKVITEKLINYGVKPGVLKYKIDTENIVNNLMVEIKELAWVGVTVKGTKVKVQVAERVKPPELVPKDTPCNIVAAKDGVIKSILAKAGLDMVKAGDTVTKGQVLISGAIPNKNDEKSSRLVHAIGSVKARTWYEGKCEVEERVFNRERTGKYLDNYSLKVFTKKINLFQKGVTYENFDRIEIRKGISLGEDLVFPFEFDIERFYENSVMENKIGIEEAKRIALDMAYKEASEDIPENVEILKTSPKFIQDKDGKSVANVVIECLEDIGVTKEIGGK